MDKPKIGILGMAFPGNNMGEEMCADKTNEMAAWLSSNKNLEVIKASCEALDETGVVTAAHEIATEDIDIILILLCSFVPDYFVVKALEICDKPVFIWAVEREMKCISLVGGCLAIGALYNLQKNFELCATDIGDKKAMEQLMIFARAGMLRSRCHQAKIGVSGGKNDIMLSLQWDEFELRKRFGVSIDNIPIEELYRKAESLDEKEVEREWQNINKEISKNTVKKADGLYSTRLYLAALDLVLQKGLSGYSVNCYPALKAKICLAVAKLNDQLCATGCESDINSTFMMYLLQTLTGKAAFNGDFLRMYNKENSILFSHCGAGAFSLAKDKSEIQLNASIETCNGCAVCYATYAKGSYTLLNMMTGKNGLRVSALVGTALPTDLEYEGTPIKIGFEKNVEEILQQMCKYGCSHHWSGAEGNYAKEIELLCKWAGVEFNLVSM